MFEAAVLNSVNNPDIFFEYLQQNLSIKQKNRIFYGLFLNNTGKNTSLKNIYIMNIFNGLVWCFDDLAKFAA